MKNKSKELFKKQLNTKNGITLIALIITVIVLLILAGTAISISLNGNSLFNKAQDSVSQHNNKVIEEETSLSNLLTQSDSFFGSKEVTVVVDEYTISFTPRDNETWYEWAIDTNDENDTGIIRAFGDLTLKQLIIKVHDDGDEYIHGFYLYNTGSLIQGNLMSDTENPENQKWNSTINPGGKYYADIFV